VAGARHRSDTARAATEIRRLTRQPEWKRRFASPMRWPEEVEMKARTIAAALSTLALCGPALAQESHDMSHMDKGAAAALPPVCPVAEEGTGMAMPPMEGASESQQALMHATMALQDAMMLGMTAADPDVAFACAMIPHHRSAIEMAKVELQDGKAGPMRDMAQAIIDAQEREIAELTHWLEQQAH
jgi:uncharacterized protein (DUF305 family)